MTYLTAKMIGKYQITQNNDLQRFMQAFYTTTTCIATFWSNQTPINLFKPLSKQIKVKQESTLFKRKLRALLKIHIKT